MCDFDNYTLILFTQFLSTVTDTMVCECPQEIVNGSISIFGLRQSSTHPKREVNFYLQIDDIQIYTENFPRQFEGKYSVLLSEQVKLSALSYVFFDSSIALPKSQVLGSFPLNEQYQEFSNKSKFLITEDCDEIVIKCFAKTFVTELDNKGNLVTKSKLNFLDTLKGFLKCTISIENK